MHKQHHLSSSIRSALYCALPLLFTSSIEAREITFDTGILQSRGLSADLNRYFAETPRFLPGVHSVRVTVNGKDRGTAAARFGEDGTLCIDEDFLDFAGLMPVPLKSAEQCHNITVDYPQAVVNALPGQETVELYLPPEALNGLNGEVKNFQHGGTAGLLNYSLFSTHSEYEGSNSNNYSQASLEGGFNFADWAIRSRYIMTDDDGDKNAESIYTYAEHVFAAQKMTMQVGEINANSDVLSGLPITGIQLTPTNALNNSGTGVSVSGIARNSQARVEVRQNGRLIFNTLVPAGPFTLDDVPMVRSNVDLEVTVIESDGTSNRFIVPASAVKAQQLSRPQGLSASVGRVRNIDSDYDDPWVFNISDGWHVLPRLNILASSAIAQDYQATGTRAEVLLADTWNASASIAGSREQFGDENSGLKTELQSSVSLSDQVSLSTSAAHYSSGYRELSDAMDDDFQPYDNSWSANVNWASGVAGSFSVGFNYNQASGDGEDSRYILASWGKTFKYASVSVNWQSSVGNTDDSQDDDMLYVNLSIPLGGSQSISSYMRNQGNRTSYGVQNSGKISPQTNYYISADRDNDSNYTSFNGSVTSNLHYTQLGVGGGSNGNHQRNYNTTLSGGVAMHKSGVTFTPYSIRNTFAIAKLNEQKAGVEMTTPQGTVWTDQWGQAVIPALNEWRSSRIEIDANKLPQSMTLANGTKYIAAAHASVSEVKFKVINSRRVMLQVKQPDGSLLPKGLSIVSAKGNYVVTTVDNGHVFLNDADQLDALYAMDNNNNRICEIFYTLSDKRDEEAFYEEANGECR